MRRSLYHIATAFLLCFAANSGAQEPGPVVAKVTNESTCEAKVDVLQRGMRIETFRIQGLTEHVVTIKTNHDEPLSFTVHACADTYVVSLLGVEPALKLKIANLAQFSSVVPTKP